MTQGVVEINHTIVNLCIVNRVWLCNPVIDCRGGTWSSTWFLGLGNEANVARLKVACSFTVQTTREKVAEQISHVYGALACGR